MLAGSSNTTTTIQSNGTTAIFIDGSQYIGVGTTSPSTYAAFVVRKAITGQGVSNASAQFSDAVNSALWVGHTSGCANLVTEASNITFGFTNGSATTERMRIGSDGKVAIGTTTTSDGRLTVKQATDSYVDCFTLISDTASGSIAWQLLSDGGSQRLFFARGGGKGYIDGTTGAYVPISDSRVKKNVVDLNYGLSEILKLRPVKYNINIEEDTAKTHIGLIAQEVKSVIDEAVDDLRNTEDMYGLDKSGLVPVLIKAIQELNAKVEAQALEIAALKATP
jgi:hypothetical protein